MEGKVMSAKATPKFPASSDKRNVIVLLSILFLGVLAVIGIVVVRQRQTLRTPAQTIMPAEICQAQGGVVFPGTSCPNGQEIIGTIDDNTICCRAPEVQEATQEPQPTSGEPTAEPTAEPTSSDTIPPIDQPVSPSATPTTNVTSGPTLGPTGSTTATPAITDIVVILATNTPVPTSGAIGGPAGSSKSSSPTPTTRPTTSSSTTAPTKVPTKASSSSSSSNQSTPTTKPTLPASGLPHASILILSLGLLVIVLGLAL